MINAPSRKQSSLRVIPEAVILKKALELAQMIFTLLQNDLIHRVFFQVFAKIFRAHSVGHLIVASTIFDWNSIKYTNVL